MNKFYPDYIGYRDSKEDIVEALKRFNEKYPAAFNAFFYSVLEDVRKEKPFNPFSHDQKIVLVSKEDMEYLRGEPAPLVITIPITIEKDK